MPRPTSVLGAAALVALLLTGCTDPQGPGGTSQSATPTPVAEPSAEPSASASPSASESAVPEPEQVIVPPQRPAEMEDDGYEGAAAAAEYFLELDDYIMKTSDTAEYEAMSHEECSTCDNRLQQARQLKESEATYLGGEPTVRIEHIYEQDGPTGIWPIDVALSIKPIRILDANDNEVQTLDETSGMQRIEVLRVKDQWVIVSFSRLEEAS